MIFSFSWFLKRLKHICGSSDLTINHLLNLWFFFHIVRCLFFQTKPNDLRDVTTDRSNPIELLASSREDTCSEGVSNMKPSQEKTGSRVGKFDPVIGISVIILTLVIMLVWGRLFAILCTSAWCYSIPRLRNVAALVKRSASDGSARFEFWVV